MRSEIFFFFLSNRVKYSTFIQTRENEYNIVQAKTYLYHIHTRLYKRAVHENCALFRYYYSNIVKFNKIIFFFSIWSFFPNNITRSRRQWIHLLRSAYGSYRVCVYLSCRTVCDRFLYKLFKTPGTKRVYVICNALHKKKVLCRESCAASRKNNDNNNNIRFVKSILLCLFTPSVNCILLPSVFILLYGIWIVIIIASNYKKKKKLHYRLSKLLLQYNIIEGASIYFHMFVGEKQTIINI